MDFTELRKSWNTLGEIAPVRAIVSSFDEGDIDAFFASGRVEVAATFDALRELGIVPRGRALDFGCGMGRITQALAAHFDSVVGVDIAASMIARAETHNLARGRVTYLVNEVDDLSLFEDATFDFVFSTIVLQHVGPELAQRYIGEFVRILAAGGIACFQLPSSLRPAARDEQEVNTSDSPDLVDGRPRQLADPGETNPKSPSWLRRLVGSRVGRLRQLMIARRELLLAPPEDPLPALIAMHGVDRDVVIKLLETSGAQVIAVLPDQHAGPEWESFRYVARRPVA